MVWYIRISQAFLIAAPVLPRCAKQLHQFKYSSHLHQNFHTFFENSSLVILQKNVWTISSCCNKNHVFKLKIQKVQISPQPPTPHLPNLNKDKSLRLISHRLLLRWTASEFHWSIGHKHNQAQWSKEQKTLVREGGKKIQKNVFWEKYFFSEHVESF